LQSEGLQGCGRAVVVYAGDGQLAVKEVEPVLKHDDLEPI
jgi:hypothetical protein